MATCYLMQYVHVCLTDLQVVESHIVTYSGLNWALKTDKP